MGRIFENGSRGPGKRRKSMTEPFVLELRRQAKWDRFLQRRPKCALCGEPILEDEALVLEGRFYCGACVSWNTEEVTDFDAGLEWYSPGL